jgi:simple sugar transport system substrate-binding protein
MMNIRIWLVLFSVLVIMACIAAPTPRATPVNPTQPPKTYQDLVVGYVQIGAESEWRTANLASIKERAEELRVSLMLYDGMNPERDQIKTVRAFIAEGVDVIGVPPLVETGWSTVFQEAKDAGIPIILVDRRADVPEDLYATYLASDFVEQGRKAGRVLAELMDGRANIVELVGTPGSSAANDRGEGFRQVLQGYPEMNIIASQNGDWTRAGGKEVMAEFLQQYGSEIDALYAHNDDMALGAIEAIEEYGLQPGVDIKIVSIDAVRGAFEAMIEGKLNATVVCNPLIGPQFFELALKVANGEDVPKWIPTKETVFYADMPDLEEIAENRKY